jgi:hypothetical protein
MSNVNPPVTTTKAELNRYFQMIDRRVPISVSQFIRWLRMPSSFAVRLVIAILLILGGIFSFLSVLGIWMLPLGSLLIAQDVPLLQKPLVAAFAPFDVEARGHWLRQIHSDASLLTGNNFLAAIVPAIGYSLDGLGTDRCACLLGHAG